MIDYYQCIPFYSYIILQMHTSEVGDTANASKQPHTHTHTHASCTTCACAPPLVYVNMLPMRRCRQW